jgi:hypothetical protein
MNIRSRVVTGSVMAATLAATVAPTASATPGHSGHQHQSNGTVFVQTDNTTSNSVVRYERTRSGGLRQDGIFPTGGRGGVLGGSQVDHLASQGSLVRLGDHLYAVNAGSNTITNFKITRWGLLREQVISSGGEFPVSIAASPDAVYVLNARSGGSIQGYRNIEGHLIKVDSWNRQLGFDPNATPEFTSTPAQIGFAPGNRELIITTKGDGSSVETFRVGAFGWPARRPTVTTLPGRAPFGFDFDRTGHLVLTEAGTNSVATFRLRHDGTVGLRDRALTGQQATCWVVVDRHTAYVSNAGSATVTSYRIRANGDIVPLQTVSTHAGTVDAAVSRDGRNLYVQTGAEGKVDAFAIGRGGRLERIGSVTVPGGVGGEGIATS